MDWKTHCVLMMQVGNKNMSEQQRMRFQFHLTTILIQNQAIHHPNQRHHLLYHPHYQLNTNNNEEIPLIETNPLPWTSKKEVLDTIKKLYFKCGGDENYEHLYIFPSKWIDLLKYESISDKTYENLQNASCTPIKFFVEENFDNWHPKTHSTRNFLWSFYLAALIKKCG